MDIYIFFVSANPLRQRVCDAICISSLDTQLLLSLDFRASRGASLIFYFVRPKELLSGQGIHTLSPRSQFALDFICRINSISSRIRYSDAARDRLATVN